MFQTFFIIGLLHSITSLAKIIVSKGYDYGEKVDLSNGYWNLTEKKNVGNLAFLEEVLEYLYTGHVDISEENAYDLMAVADYFLLPSLNMSYRKHGVHLVML